MRKTIFIFLIGVFAGIGYTQNDAFKEWVDEGVEMGKETVSGWFSDAKESTMSKDKKSILDSVLKDDKEDDKEDDDK